MHAYLADGEKVRNIAPRNWRRAIVARPFSISSNNTFPKTLHTHTHHMGKRVRISNDSLNSYGTRVLTAGMNVEQYQRNPVLLYMHERGEVIGYVKDLRVEDNEVTGELMFDCATDLSRQCKKQWEFGSLKMVSAGLDVLEMSEDENLLVDGQTSPTITRSKLFEVSLVDIGANDDAIVLCREGRRITLGREGANPLPLLTHNNIQTKQTTTHMEQTALALQLGLKPDASEADIVACIASLKAAGEENAKLVKEQTALRLAAVTAAVDKALGEHRIAPDRREEFITLGREIGSERLERLFSAMAPQVKLSQLVHTHGEKTTEGAGKTYTRLGEVPTDELLKMRSEDRAEYCRLYRAEYGVECEL